MGGIETIAAAVGATMAARLPGQNKKQREGLAFVVATALAVRSVTAYGGSKAERDPPDETMGEPLLEKEISRRALSLWQPLADYASL